MKESKDKFPLSNVVLYAKGWYPHTENVWEDLKKVLELDGYTPFTNNDIYYILTGAWERFDIQQSKLREVLIGIHPSECWKIGYYTKGCTWGTNPEKYPEYDMPTAFTYYVLSSLRFIDNTRWNPITPKYTKLKRPSNISINKVFTHFIEPKIKGLAS
jgi:hypothetical protein